MPLLLCPNDNGAMQTVQRSGVEFDICPNCRGVWLDRGELEKLLAAARDDSPAAQSDSGRPVRAAALAPRPQRDRDDRRDWDDDDSRFHQKKRRSSIFDIFD